MEAQRRRLLEQIGDGVSIFEPLRRTSTGLIEFQQMVEELQAMERDGLIGRCLTHRSEIAGQEFYARAHILQGLTQKGEALLDRLKREGRA